MTLNWAMGTQDTFNQLGITVTDANLKLNMDGVDNYLIHIDLQSDSLGAIARARPSVEILTDEELSVIKAIYVEEVI